MALSDKKQLTLTKKELLVLEEMMADYATACHASQNSDDYSFNLGHGVVHSEKEMEDLFFKLESARFS